MSTETRGQSIFERFIDWLRGDYKSIRFRFYRLPLAKLRYWLARLGGKSYTQWYAERMDSEAALSVGKPLAARYLDTAVIQLDYLKEHGLRPEHTFLEYGAGVLRAGILFIPYLEPGKYTGCDISKLRLDKGIALATERGIPRERYNIVTISTAEGKELGNTKFDFIWSHDVFCHMPLNECEACLVALKRNVSPDGKIFLTFTRGDEYREFKLKDFWYTNEQFLEMCRRAGWKAEEQKDWEKYRVPESEDQAMVMLTLP